MLNELSDNIEIGRSACTWSLLFGLGSHVGLIDA
jgi:hypothetical protein